jgi:hypothetical protein
MQSFGLAGVLLLIACGGSQTVLIAADSHTHVYSGPVVAGDSDEPPECAGTSIEVVGETRDGRALGQALLQLSARPWVDVFVDRVPIGRSPVVAENLDAGPRELRFLEPELGYDCTMRLHVHAGLRYAIAVDAEVDAP